MLDTPPQIFVDKIEAGDQTLRSSGVLFSLRWREHTGEDIDALYLCVAGVL